MIFLRSNNYPAYSISVSSMSDGYGWPLFIPSYARASKCISSSGVPNSPFCLRKDIEHLQKEHIREIGRKQSAHNRANNWYKKSKSRPQTGKGSADFFSTESESERRERVRAYKTIKQCERPHRERKREMRMDGTSNVRKQDRGCYESRNDLDSYYTHLYPYPFFGPLTDRYISFPCARFPGRKICL